MLRNTITLLCALFAITLAVAQPDVIRERKEIMRGNGQAVRAGTEMIRGEAAFDPAAAVQAFENMAAGMDRFANLFPPGSEVGETHAGPAI
jgi:cytochrome c556